MSDLENGIGDPTPVEINGSYSGVVLAIVDSASPGGVFQLTTLHSGVTQQHPIVNPNATFLDYIVHKVEIWGPTSGTASLSPTMYQPQGFAGPGVTTFGAFANTRKQVIDVGTTARRAHCSYEWPKEYQTVWGYRLGADLDATLFQYAFSSGGTAFGTYGIIHVHFSVRSPEAVATPSLYLSVITGKRKHSDWEHEEEVKAKVARIRAMTLPEITKE